MLEKLAFVGFTLDVVGKLLIAYTAIRVHHRYWRRHKVDEVVFKAMGRESKFGLWGIVLIILGYLLQLPTKLPGY